MPKESDVGAPLRPIPNLRPFKDTILRWDFFSDVVDDKKRRALAEEDEAMPKQISGQSEALQDVPLHFESEQQYIKVMRPLFFEEVKMQVERCKHEEMKDSEEVELLSMKPETDGCITLVLQREKTRSETMLLSGNDLVLLSQKPKPLEETPEHLLAIVVQSFGVNLTVEVRVNLECKPGTREFGIVQLIAKRQNWYVARVTSLPTQIREYEALMSLPQIPLRNFIVNKEDAVTTGGQDTQAAPAPPGMTEDGGVGFETNAANSRVTKAVAANDASSYFDIPPALQTWIESTYNSSQQQAINDSRKLGGITLVQGPPGTGKTTTILGILAMLLNATAKASRAVSYTRTSRTAEEPAEEKNGDSKNGKSGIAAGKQDTKTQAGAAVGKADDVKMQIQARRKGNLEKFRSRTPWISGNYVPWNDGLEQELTAAAGLSVKVPYAKVDQKARVPLWNIEQDEAPQKILVCAPSNAAIDEVCRRIVKDGVADATGVRKKVALVRLGPNTHKDLDDYNFDKVARKRMEAFAGAKDRNQFEIEKVKLLKEARIVCTTLSISGHRDLVGFPTDFDTVVVDEASQAVELSLMVSLKLGCRRLILVGDPQQLPATCFSSLATDHNYERSLFQRLQMSQHKVNMLDAQYRMHPAISAFPSHAFYDDKLKNVLDTKAFESKFPAAWSKIPCFGAVAFFHLQKTEMQEMKFSFVNKDEAKFVIELIKALEKHFPQENWKKKLAVITPYAEQVTLIRQEINKYYDMEMEKPKNCLIDVNTVDGFQGREKDCIIFSSVRASRKGKKNEGIGFVRDKRRMNVAFTRARTNLWAVGQAKVLRRNDDWRAFIKMQQSANPCRLFKVKDSENYFENQIQRANELGSSAPPDDDADDGEDLKLDEESDGQEEEEDLGKDVEEVSDAGDAADNMERGKDEGATVDADEAMKDEDGKRGSVKRKTPDGDEDKHENDIDDDFAG